MATTHRAAQGVDDGLDRQAEDDETRDRESDPGQGCRESETHAAGFTAMGADPLPRTGEGDSLIWVGPPTGFSDDDQ